MPVHPELVWCTDASGINIQAVRTQPCRQHVRSSGSKSCRGTGNAMPGHRMHCLHWAGASPSSGNARCDRTSSDPSGRWNSGCAVAGRPSRSAVSPEVFNRLAYGHFLRWGRPRYGAQSRNGLPSSSHSFFSSRTASPSTGWCRSTKISISPSIFNAALAA